MSAPHSFGRITDSTGNGTPVVRSARIKAIVAQRLALQNVTTTAPDNTETPSSSQDPEETEPVAEPSSGTKKRSHDSSGPDDEDIAGSDRKDDESTKAPRPHKRPKSQTNQLAEDADIQGPTEARSEASEGQADSEPRSDQAEDDAGIKGPTETRSVASEGQVEPKPRSDQAEEDAGIQNPTETRSVTNEEQAAPEPQSAQGEEVPDIQSPTATRSVANEGHVQSKPQSDQTEEVADIHNTTATRSVTNEEHADNEPSLPEADKSFYNAIITVVLWLRVLDQQRAAQKDCLAKQTILRTLMDRKHPFLDNVPIGEQYATVRDGYRSDFERYERNLEERSAQAETARRDIPDLVESTNARMDRFDDFVRTSTALPDVSCLKDSAHFRTAFERCQFYSRILADLEGEISGVEQEKKLSHDRIDSYASRLAKRGLEVAGSTAIAGPTVPAAESREDQYSPAQEFQENISTRLARLQELRAGLQKSKQAYYGHKENLARVAEKLLIEAGMLQSSASLMEKPMSAPNAAEQPETVGDDDRNRAEAAESRPSGDEEENVFANRQAQHDALLAELMAAQRNLCDAEKAFQNSRKFTEEELAQLPNTITEDEFGPELKRKLTRTTRNYIDAQKRVQDAQAEGRRLRVPAVDRFPIDQTWNFEDRTDDGYLDSVFAAKVERSKPRVEAWLPQLNMPGEPLSPSQPQEAPESLPNIDWLRLGADNADDVSSAQAKERIAKYQQACEDLRRRKLFPVPLPDSLIEGEQSRPLNSHMI